MSGNSISINSLRIEMRENGAIYVNGKQYGPADGSPAEPLPRPHYTAAIYLGRPGFRDVATRAAEASGIRARPAEEISQGGNTLWVIPSSPLPELVRRLPEEVRSRRADGDVVIGVCDISKASGIESALAGLVTDDLRVIWYRDDGTSLGLYSALIDAFKRYADAPPWPAES